MNRSHLDLAIHLSLENVKNNKGGPFGAVIVENDQIIATGVNQVTALNDPTAHAEIVALRNACVDKSAFHLPQCIVYTSCEPCPMCLSALYWAHIKTIYFANTKADAARIGFDDSFIYEEINKQPQDRSLTMVHIKDTTAQEAFDFWKHQHTKIDY